MVMSEMNGPASYGLRLKVRAWQKQMMLDEESILPERRSSVGVGKQVTICQPYCCC